MAGPIVLELHQPGASVRRLVLQPAAARDHTARVDLDDLTPDTRHEYVLRAEDAATVAGHFTTAPAPDVEAPLRLVWGADVGARGSCRRAGDDYAVFDAMAARQPDRFLFLGDTVYADHRCAGGDVVPGADFIARTLPEFHARHRYNRESPAVQRFLARTPVWATWDDHDVRNNFAGPHEPLMPVGRQAFVDYWPVAAPAEDPWRLYRRFRHGRLVELFILDTRQYRSRNCRPDGANKTLLGARQRDWLVDALASSTARWKLVGSSVPLSIPKAWPCGDSWAPAELLLFETGFAREREAVLRALHDRGVANVVFLAGDVHFALLAIHEPWRGFRVHELIAGPLAARPKHAEAPDGRLDSRVLFSVGGVATFGELAVDATGATARIFDAVGALRGSARLTELTRPAD